MLNDKEIIKPACAEVNKPYPMDVVCSTCGVEVEVWSDEEDPRCPGCGASLRDSKED